MAVDPRSGLPILEDEPHVEAVPESLATVEDGHDHAEGRGLPVVRAVGDAGAGYGLVPPGAVVWFRTLAEVTAAGAGWTRETTLDGLLPIGAGTTFSQTFAEATSYGSAWLHNHADDHSHVVNAHGHTISHDHTLAHDHTIGHTHDLANHTHGLQNHTHDLASHTHGGPSHTHGLGNVLNKDAGGAGALTVSLGTATVADGTGNTGSPSNNTSGTPSNNTSATPSSNTSGGTSAASSGGASTSTTSGASSSTSGTDSPSTNNKSAVGGQTGFTSNTTWLPPARCGVFARKL